jgi:hypothetical protein
MTLTNADLLAGARSLAAFPFADLEAAIAAKGASLPDDLAVAEDVAGILATIGIPFAGDAELALEVLGFVLPLAATIPPPDVAPYSLGVPDDSRGR